jgi:tetratricopeptide (TPR) repeat protein
MLWRAAALIFSVAFLMGIVSSTTGAQTPDNLTTLNQQFAQLYAAGKYAEAMDVAKDALTMAERVFGADHPNVVIHINNLALLYRVQRNYGDTEALYRRALAISEKALGKNHPNVGAALLNLTLLYQAQGRFPEAEPLMKRALASRVRSALTRWPARPERGDAGFRAEGLCPSAAAGEEGLTGV